jgi:hypothetical protein
MMSLKFESFFGAGLLENELLTVMIDIRLNIILFNISITDSYVTVTLNVIIFIIMIGPGLFSMEAPSEAAYM